MSKSDDLISRQALCEYALNQKDKCVTPNDIMRFPSAQLDVDKRELVRTITTGIIATSTKDVYSCGMRNGMRWCKALLEDEPPKFEDARQYAEQEQRWIPCSEETGDGYPEKDGLYYVTEQNYGFYLDADYKQRVSHTSHFKNGDFTDRFYTENHSNITAWMPLPEPYKGEI